MTWNDLQEYADFNRDFLAAVQDAIKAGKTADEAAATLKFARPLQGLRHAARETNVQAIYGELKSRPTPAVADVCAATNRVPVSSEPGRQRNSAGSERVNIRLARRGRIDPEGQTGELQKTHQETEDPPRTEATSARRSAPEPQFRRRTDETRRSHVVHPGTACRRWTSGSSTCQACAAFHRIGQEFSADAFEEGMGFDGSSIRGFQEIQEATCCSCRIQAPRSSIVHGRPTVVLICDVKDPVTGEWYTPIRADREEGRGVLEVEPDRR